MARVPLRHLRFVLPSGRRALEPIARGLRAAGATVIPMPVYRTVPRRPSAETARALSAGVDAILFHCPSAVSSFVEAGLPVGDAIVVCVGATTGARAHALGLRPVVPEGYGDAAMLAATEAAWEKDAVLARPPCPGSGRATVT